MPKLSIIVPVYNVEKYLPDCLDSLINQTLTDIEIISVNDASTDSSGEILLEYANKDSRIKIINQENQGQAVARNLALNHAQGEFIGFVDSDDWVDLDYFEKMYNAAKENDCEIACAGFKSFKYAKGRIKKHFKKVEVIKDINKKILADNLPDNNYIWNKIYKRDKWNFEFPAGRYFEDMAILIKILFDLGDMVTVPDTYYHYRKREDSTVRTKTKKHREDFKWAINELYTFAKENKIKLKERNDLTQKEYLKIFGLTVMKSLHYENSTKYKLFGFIPVASKIVK